MERHINHLMYADDLVVLSPSGAGLLQLLENCSGYGVQYDIKYNAKKVRSLLPKLKRIAMRSEYCLNSQDQCKSGL